MTEPPAPAPAAPVDPIEGALESQLGRLVAFVLTPLLLTAVGWLSAWTSQHLGLELNSAETVAYITTVVIGVALVALRWLWVHGKGYLVALGIQKAHDVTKAM
jgi:hypothetical protein